MPKSSRSRSRGSISPQARSTYRRIVQTLENAETVGGSLRGDQMTDVMDPRGLFAAVESSETTRWHGHEHDPHFEMRLLRVLEYGVPGLRLYFDPANGFAGRTFDLLGRSEPTGGNEVDVSDLLAVTLLDVCLPPDAIRLLLEEARDVPPIFLTHIRDLDMWDPTTEEDLRWANAFWHWLCGIPGISWVIAGKLLARLRPRLVPVYDQVVKRVLPSDHFWEAMACPHPGRLLDAVVHAKEAAHLDSGYPSLRVIDSAAWMLGSRSKNVKRFLEWDSPDVEFFQARAAFWEAVGERDPLERE